MLSFVGLGLYDERSVTVEGKERIRAADQVFVELYTSRLVGAEIEAVAAYHDVEIEVCDRTVVEQEPDPILDTAAQGDAVFLTAGDPMIATTHVDLRLRAHDRGIDTAVIHGVTAQAAASSLTGLQNYRFGPSTTLPFPDAHGADGLPESVTATIDENQDRDCHTLIFLDIKAAQDRYMTADTACELLANRYGDQLAVVVARAGSPDPLLAADRISTLSERSFGDPLHLLVVPGSLHHIESDALATFADAPAALL